MLASLHSVATDNADLVGQRLRATIAELQSAEHPSKSFDQTNVSAGVLALTLNTSISLVAYLSPVSVDPIRFWRPVWLQLRQKHRNQHGRSANNVN